MFQLEGDEYGSGRRCRISQAKWDAVMFYEISGCGNSGDGHNSCVTNCNGNLKFTTDIFSSEMIYIYIKSSLEGDDNLKTSVATSLKDGELYDLK